MRLFPAEEAESDCIDDYGPGTDDAELRCQVYETCVLGDDQADSFYYRAERDELGYLLKRVGHQERREKYT